MKCKSIIIAVLAILVMMSITSACATDTNETALASEDIEPIEQMNENQNIDESTLEKTDPDYDLSANQNASKSMLKSADNNDLLKESTTVTQHTSDAIQQAIDSGYDTLYLEPGTYTVTGYINIGFKNFKIIGNSTILDGQGQTQIFYISNSNIMMQNITFKNANTTESGGVAGITTSSNVVFCDCAFVNNTACDCGGAIYLSRDNYGLFSNCIFENNRDGCGEGGAIFAQDWGNVALDRCVFKTDNDTVFNTYDLEVNLNVFDFISTYNSGEKLKINFTANSPLIKNANITMEIFNNGAWYRNGSFLSDESWIVDLPAGKYIAFFKTADYDSKPVNATITITDGTTFYDLNKKINGNDSQYIILDKNYTYNSTFDADFINGIEITRNVTIDGMAMTLNGDGKARIFKVTNANVTFKNINFINGFIYENNGGGAIYNKGATCIAINCNFTNNTANGKYGGRGGAMYECTAINCTFQYNTATGEHGSGGGAMYEGTAINCTFQNNKAEPGVFVGIGGAMYYGTAINCNFTNNTATDGGAMNEGTAINCTFQKNHGTKWGGAKYGGTAISCIFINNTCSLGGGMAGGSAINCTFINNTAEDGGAIATHNTAITCIFINNTATDNGGAMASSKAVLCYFENNTPGDFLSENITDLLKVSNITTTYKSGEKLLFSLEYEDYVFDGLNTTISIYKNGIWKANYTALTGQGWIIDLEPGIYTATLTVRGHNVDQVNITVAIPYTFTDLNNTINRNDNATIDLWDNYTYSVVDTNFTNGIEIARNVTIDGHGITINADGKARIFEVIRGNVTFKNINFKNGFIDTTNKDHTGGGAIYNTHNNPCIAINCTFTNNTATGGYGYGGAARGITALNCIFTNNSVTGDKPWGGAMYESTAINCTFKNNRAHSGGAMQDGTAINCTFENNQAEYGGAIQNVKATNCTFKNNLANEGGAMNEGTAINCTFENNTAEYGGAIDNAIAISCNFTNNTATYCGGALYVSTAINCTFKSNNATRAGGAMEGGTATLCTFENNTAPNGGAMLGGTEILCIFKTSSDTINLTEIQPTFNVSNCNFTYASGEKLLFNLTYSGKNYDGYNATVNITKDGAPLGLYNALSGDDGGWVVNLDCGTYNVTLNLETYLANPVNVTLTVKRASTQIDVAKNTTLIFNQTSNLNARLKPDAGEMNYESNDTSVVSVNSDGTITAHNVGTAVILISFKGSENYNASNATVNVTVTPAKSSVNSEDIISTYGEPITVKITSENAIDIIYQIIDEKANVILNATVRAGENIEGLKLDAGRYMLNLTTVVDKNHLASSASSNITVTKRESKITTQPLTTTYGVNEYLVIGLKDSGANPIRNVDAFITIHGVTYPCRSDDEGNARLIIRLNPGTYTAEIKINDANYAGLTQYVQVTVLKAKVKITAKKKTFKATKKVKKYTVTLKANGKAVKKAKVTLKIKGKTYKAKTNSKGKATFKIKKFNKKGKFNAVIRFKANNYYKKATKKVKLVFR